MHVTIRNSMPAKMEIDGAVAILDAGAQYTKVIDRRVRELKVRPCDMSV